MSVVESRVAACRQAICAALDDCTAEIKAGVTEAVNPEAVQVYAPSSERMGLTPSIKHPTPHPALQAVHLEEGK